jgi:5-(hydroxymethyl)furfural/furfural oxidase
MFTLVANKTAWNKVGQQTGSFVVAVYKTYLETGQVRLRSSDWREEPLVDFNHLSDPRDLERLMDGVRRFGAMHLTPIVRSVTSDPFPATNTDRVRRVGRYNRKNKIITEGLAMLPDGPTALRRYLIETLAMEGVSPRDVLTDDDKLEAYVRGAEVGMPPAPAAWGRTTIRCRSSIPLAGCVA